MMEPYLFTEGLLPEGFLFPHSYIDFVSRESIPDLDPWWFLCTSQRDADGWFQAVKKLYPERKLVPFALWDGSDDIACFDASVPTADPLVHYVHAYASSGWEDRGHVANFTEWLKVTEEESARYKTEREEGR
ncbi:hypothetical protein SAMN04515617_1445 [Collimonas sp. OK242]|uniref:hypothetical protein n=1 Tax=Collimonas sp. OK242 TaxID=1798195 RepID=UPI000894AC61|nr:hypothetical protein [Collimonas sp. OK242]SDY98805.1 hypothetical protein SAMN04515617_1445 [Collimonas sp. OK242]